MEQTVAIIGLGTMGMGMAKNLLRAGLKVHAYNRTRSKAESLAVEGAQIHDSPAEAARDAAVVITMLSDDSASREAWSGARGALQTARPGTILIESSTVTPHWVEELQSAASASGLDLLDAPVTGSRVQAEGGKLNFLVGGDARVVERARFALEAMGQSITHLGPIGSGARLKLVNNFLCGVQVASLAEGLAWIERSGLDREQALEVLKAGAPGSPLLAAMSTRMVEAKYEVNFALPLMQKDLQYAQADARRLGVELRSAAIAESRFDDAVRAGMSHKDMSAVIEPLRTEEPK